MLTHDSKHTHTHNKTQQQYIKKIVGISELRTMYICSTIISSRVIVDTNDFFQHYYNLTKNAQHKKMGENSFQELSYREGRKINANKKCPCYNFKKKLKIV